MKNQKTSSNKEIVKYVVGGVAAFAALVVLLKAATPNQLTIFVNNGDKCKNSTAKLKKQKAKKQKKIKRKRK